MYEAERETTSIAVAGDSLLTRRLRVFGEGRYLRLRGVLHRAGLRFANLESTGNAHLDATHAQHQGGGTCMTTAEPACGIGRVAALSRSYGTHLECRDGVGVIRG